MRFLLVSSFMLCATTMMSQNAVVNDSIYSPSVNNALRITASSQAIPWTKEVGLRYNMPIVAKLYKCATLFQPTGVLLGIFKDNKCWGYAGIGSSPVGPLMNVTMGYNTATATNFTYKVYVPSTDQIYEVVETVNFANGVPVGQINLPISLNLKFAISTSSNDVSKGTVSGTSGSFTSAQSVSLTATPTAGNRFIKWTTTSGVLVSRNANYNVTATDNLTLIAHFDEILASSVNDANATTSSLPATITDVTINSGGTLSINAPKEVYSLTVVPGAKINLTQPLTVVGDVTFKADQNNSFSANIGSGMTVSGTVRYVKTMNDDEWYFMSFPCNVTISEITQVGGPGLGNLGSDWFINYYDGESRIANLGVTSNWKNVNVATPTHLNTLTLEANKGYIFGLKTGVGTKDVAFVLDKALVAASESAVRSIPVVAYGNGAPVANNHKGWNLVGQPYLSRFKGANASGLTLISFPTAKGKTYHQDTKESFTSIDPFAAYFIQADATLETNGISFALAGRQLSASTVDNSQSDRVQINFSSPTGSDITNLILNNDQSVEYTIGQDLEKMLGLGTSQPQVYTNLNGINFAFNSLPINNVSNLSLGFYTQTAGSNVISVDATQAPELSQLILTDNKNNTSTDLLTSNYSFIAEAGTNNTRFSITAKRISTDNNSIESATNSPIIRTVGNLLTISNVHQIATVNVFDAMGRLVINKQMSGNSIEIPLSTAGVYNVQLLTREKNWSLKTIIK